MLKAYGREIILGLCIIGGALFLALRAFAPHSPQSKTHHACKTEEFQIADEWLEGRLSRGQTLRAIPNWRECGLELKKGTIALHRVSPAHAPAARIIAAIPGDHFSLRASTNPPGWNIEINGELFLEADQKTPYRFGSPAPPVLKLYEQAHAGLLDSSSVLLFSSRSPGDQDSGSLGVLNSADIYAIAPEL